LSCWKAWSTRNARGAKIYGEVIGYGMSGDAYHITAPSESGDGAYRCMRAALKNAKIDASDIDYINAHGTSTPMGDEIELSAVERLFGQHGSQAVDVVDQVGGRGICSGRQVRWKRCSHCWRCAIKLRRQP